MNAQVSEGIEVWSRAGIAMWTAAAVFLLAGAGAGPAAAQGTYYADLNAAVPGLAGELVEDDRLTGKKVLVNVHDFFEERTGRSLPLSKTLHQRFRTELSVVRGVEVLALPKGSEDEMVIVQGVWRELPEPGIRPESRKIDLVVSLIELTESGHRVLLAAQGRIDAVDDGLLTPDLDSWGRHLVRELERRAGGRGRRVFHVGEIHLDGVAEPERLRKYLVRRWLFPAFSQSRLFGLAAGGGEGSGGVLDMNVFVHAGQVEIALTASDRGGVHVASANVKMAWNLLPEGYLSTTGPDPIGRPPDNAEPEPVMESVFRDCDVCPEMVVVPAGSYMMGSPSSEAERHDDEGPVHEVTMASSFAVGKYEVTFDEWDACVSAGGCFAYRPDDGGWGRGRRPVINVSWEEARGYVRWLSQTTGQGYRLLSESEWEYVARAGTVTPFHFGSTISTDQANYEGTSTYGSGRRGRYRERTVPVGSFPSNAFGVHDVHGNVWEWVEDCWHGGYRGAPADGSAWESGDCSRRVLRGGSWDDVPRYLRSASRIRGLAVLRFLDNGGFRVAMTLD